MSVKIGKKKGSYEAVVVSNRAISKSFYRASFELREKGARAFGNAMPGQFTEFDLSQTALPYGERIPAELLDASKRQILLRRPFSFCDIRTSKNKTEADVIYSLIGPGTLRMMSLSAGEKISVIGPLGSGFSIPKRKKTAILVAGGMGAPPLMHLAQYIFRNHKNIKLFIFNGAQTAEELIFKSQIPKKVSRLGVSQPDLEGFITATDDGSAGHHGFITECLVNHLEKQYEREAKEMIVYACGPEPMLARVAEITRARNIDCQLSMERMMACGIGLCQSCAVECGDESGSVYKLCCKDGPIFDGRKVMFIE